MASACKIVKGKGEALTPFEKSIAEAIMEIELSSDIRAQLRELTICGASEIDVGGGKQAIVVFVPVSTLKKFQKIHVRFVGELEKKFSGKHVVIVGKRRMLPKPTRKTKTASKQKRPRSRTLTAVHDAILEDILYPCEIYGKRTRFQLDGARFMKVHLEKEQEANVGHKIESYSAVYKKLTGKIAHLMFVEYNREDKLKKSALGV